VKRVALLLTVVPLTACEGRALQGDGGQAWQADGGSCSCGSFSTVAGTLDGQSIRLDHVYWGVTATWGTHHNPVSPMEAVGIRVLLSGESITCSGGSGEQPDTGPILWLDLQTDVTQKALALGWHLSDGRYVGAKGQACLESIPVQENTPVGYPANVSGTVRGCATLSLDIQDKPVGQVSGAFSSSDHCPAIDEAFGE
jgi:hypothetical protein